MKRVLVAAVMIIAAVALDGAARTSAVDESQYEEPILVSSLAGGRDVIPVDAAGIGGAHLVRLPLDERSPATRAVEEDMVRAMNFERQRRGLFPLVYSENLTAIEHRWLRWVRRVFGSGCPPFLGGPQTSCDVGLPWWDEWQWGSPRFGGIAAVGGGAQTGASTFSSPGGFVSGLISSPGHRVDLLGLDGRFVGLGVDCQPDGSTHLTYTVWDYDRAYTHATPSTYQGTDLTPQISPSFGRRCPQPGPPFTVTPGAGTLTVSPDASAAFAALTAGQLEIGGPTLGIDPFTWSYRLRVYDASGAEIGSPRMWRIIRKGPLGAEPVPPLVVDGLVPGGTYRLVLQSFNEYETSLPVERTAAASSSTPGGGGAGGSTGAVGFEPVTPRRVADTRWPGQRAMYAGEVRAFDLTGAPAGVVAVTMNVTAVGPSEAGFLTLHSCDSRTPETSNVNAPAGVDTPNQVTVAVGADRRICVYASTGTHVLLDVAGWWRHGATGVFTATTPTRIFDARPSQLAAGSVVELDLSSRLPRGVTSVTLTVTSTRTDADGFVTVDGCSVEPPTVSNLNQRRGLDRANLVTVAVAADRRLCLRTSSPGALVVDLLGSWSPAAATPTFEALAVPRRVLDTRRDGGRLAAGEIRRVLAPRAGSSFVNVTVDRTSAAGWLASFPCDDGFGGTSSVNYAASAAASTAVLLDTSRGGVCVLASASTDVLVDVFATVTP